MILKILKWILKKCCPGFHISRNPVRKTADIEVVKATQEILGGEP